MQIEYRPNGQTPCLTEHEVAEAVAFAKAVKVRRPAPEGKVYKYDLIEVTSVTRIADTVILEIKE